MKEDRPEVFESPSESRLGLYFLGCLSLVLVFWTLHEMAAVAVPIVFAALSALMVAPFDLRVKRALPERLAWTAHLLSVLVLFAGFILFVAALVFAAQQVLAEMPNFSERLSQIVSSSGSENGGSGWRRDVRDLWNQTGSDVGSWAVGQVTWIAERTATMTGVFTTSVFLVMFSVFMLLDELGEWREKLRSTRSGKTRSALSESLRVISRKLRVFLMVRTLVGFLQAALYVGWLSIFGMDLLLVWGVVTFLLTFIPTLGSIIAGSLPVLYALLLFHPLTVLLVAAGIFVIEQVVGNYLDPVILGQRLLLSPLVILIALLFWGWFWGVAGAFLATPITMSLLILFNHMPRLRPLALMLSNQTSHEELDAALAA